MDLTFDRAVLLPALADLARIVEKRDTIPVLTHIRLRTTGAGEVALTATDLDIEVTKRIPAGGSAEIDTTAPGRLLADIARKLPEDAEIGLSFDGDRLLLRSGRSRFSLMTLPTEDFPRLADADFAHRLTVPGQSLAAALAAVAFAVSTEETRYYLNGVFLHPVANEDEVELRAVATDGHRLARAVVAGVTGLAAEMPAVIVPTKTAAELRRLGEAAGEEPVTLDVSPSKIRVAAGATSLVSKLIDGTYPDYVRVIPAGNDKCAGIDPLALRPALARVATLARSDRGRAVRLALSEGRATLTVVDPEAGEASEEVDVDYAGPHILIGFNPRYLEDALEVLGAAAPLPLALGDPGSPALFGPRDDLLVVLMPMRV